MATLTADSFDKFIFIPDNIFFNEIIEKLILLTEVYSVYVRTGRYPGRISGHNELAQFHVTAEYENEESVSRNKFLLPY
jgi:hypothetical protein